MRTFTPICPRLARRVAAACVFASALGVAAPAPAQDAFAPTYARTRLGAHDWRHRGDGHGFGNHHRRHGYDNYYHDPYFYGGPVVTGSYYQRPYPYHFDYYRHRWGGPPPNGGYGGYSPESTPAANDCPCADPPPVEVVH